MNIEAGFLKSRNETCETYVGAVFIASQHPKIVGISLSEATGSHAMLATKQEWCGVITRQTKRKETALPESEQWSVTS